MPSPNPTRRYLRNSARFRALTRLKLLHEEEFAKLFEEELAEGPIFYHRPDAQPVDSSTVWSAA